MIRLLKERFSVCALLLAMCISCVQRPDIEGTLPPEIHSVHLSLSETTATLEAQIRSHNSSFLEAGFYFGAAKDKMEKRPCQAYGSTFSLTSEGLTYETDYYYCAYISNGINEIRTDILKFTTGEEPVFIRNIEFEDPYAELLCIRHYDSNRDGYLSYEEAAAVTSVEQLGDEANRKNIVSFNELKHFTSLREFSLPGCHSIKNVTLPENLETIGEDAFNEWESIKEIAIAVWEALKAFFQAAWEAIKTTAVTVWNAIKDFFLGEISTFGYLVRWSGRDFSFYLVDVDQFALYLTLVNVGAHQCGACGIYAYLFGTLAHQSFGHCLAHGNVSTHGGVPFAGLYIFPIGALL